MTYVYNLLTQFGGGKRRWRARGGSPRRRWCSWRACTTSKGRRCRSAPAYDVETEGTGATAGHGAPPAEVQRDLRRRLIRRFRRPSKVRGVRRHGWPMDNEAYGEIHDKL